MLSLQSFLREGRSVCLCWAKSKPKGPKGLVWHTERSERTTPGWATKPNTRIGDDSSEALVGVSVCQRKTKIRDHERPFVGVSLARFGSRCHVFEGTCRYKLTNLPGIDLRNTTKGLACPTEWSGQAPSVSGEKGGGVPSVSTRDLLDPGSFARNAVCNDFHTDIRVWSRYSWISKSNVIKPARDWHKLQNQT